MNLKLLFAICFLYHIIQASDALAQGFVIDSVKYGPDTVYITPDISASFPGGKQRMYDYIKIKFDVYEDGVGDIGGAKEGIMDVNFVVETNGRVKYVFIGKSISPLYDEEMIRTLEAMPKWEPAMVHGKKVRSLQNLRYTLDFYQR